MKSFADFEIWIHQSKLPLAEDKLVTYEAQVFSSPTGRAVGELKLDLSDPTFQTNLAQVSGIASNHDLRKNFGQGLFDALFTGNVLKAWIDSWGRIKGGLASGLRLRLMIEDAELALLPWELLHDPDKGFLAVFADTAVARYLSVPEPPLMVQQKPLRILIIVESPKGNGLAPISEAEQLSLKAALDALGDGVSYRVLNNASTEEIQSELQRDPHVLHFLGHGTSGQLALVSKDYQVRLIDDQEFSTLFLGRRSIRLAVLNACHSSAAAGGLFTGIGPALVKAGLPAVVAMQYPTVQLETAGTFSRALYRALANGLPIDMAVNEGRNLLAVDMSLASRDWSTPVLYTGTRSGRIIDFPDQNTEVVGNAWETVQVAARESGAVAAVAELSQRFKSLADRHRILRVLMETANRLHSFRMSYAPIDDLVRQARGVPENLPFATIKLAWTQLSQNQWQPLDAFLQAHEEMSATDWYAQLVEKRNAVNSAIKAIAYEDLHSELNGYKDLLSQTEAHIRQQMDDAVVDLVSFSDQTLPLLSAK